MDDASAILSPAQLVLPEPAPARDPVAAAADIGPRYLEAYDRKTLLYDCLHQSADGTITLIGPPLLNLRRLIKGVSVDGRAVEFSVQPRNKLDQIRIAMPEGTQAQEICLNLGAFGRHSLPVPARATAFEDRRVLLTLFRYEPVAWVLDWARFHVALHGVDAILLYANHVAPARLAEIARGFRQIAGLAAFAIVRWDFPYGPVQDDAFAPGVPITGTRRWKSCFCQTGMFEHARLRFLAQAQAVLNMDIDELALHDHGVSVFDSLEAGAPPVLMLQERRVGPGADQPVAGIAARRHGQFHHILPPGPRGVQRKWVLAPQRLAQMAPQAQWMTHEIRGAQAALHSQPLAWYAHFAPINTGWSDQGRAGLAAAQTSAPDPVLKAAFRRLGWG